MKLAEGVTDGGHENRRVRQGGRGRPLARFLDVLGLWDSHIHGLKTSKTSAGIHGEVFDHRPKGEGAEGRVKERLDRWAELRAKRGG